MAVNFHPPLQFIPLTIIRGPLPERKDKERAMPELPGVIGFLWSLVQDVVLVFMLLVFLGLGFCSTAWFLEEAFGIDVFPRLRRRKK